MIPLIDTQYPSRRQYLDSLEGQFHVRRFGDPAGRAVVLLHWTPGSGAMLAHAGAALGALGHDVWVPDLLGFGLSDKPEPAGWTQQRHGAALAAALRDAGLRSIVLHGGHMGGEVAMETAIAAPALIDAVVLDGIATDWSPAQRGEILGQIGYAPPAYDGQGSPLGWGWEKTLWLWQAWVPGLTVDAHWAATLHQAMLDVMHTGFAPGAMKEAFGAYPAAERLALIRQPVLALSADSDTLRAHLPNTVGALHDVRAHVFAGVHPCHRPDGGADYAAVLDRFIRGDARGWLTKDDDLSPGANTSAGYDLD